MNDWKDDVIARQQERIAELEVAVLDMERGVFSVRESIVGRVMRKVTEIKEMKQ